MTRSILVYNLDDPLNAIVYDGRDDMPIGVIRNIIYGPSASDESRHEMMLHLSLERLPRDIEAKLIAEGVRKISL